MVVRLERVINLPGHQRRELVVVLEHLVAFIRAQPSLFLQAPKIKFQLLLSFVRVIEVAQDSVKSLLSLDGTPCREKRIRYALVQLGHPYIKKTFTESNVVDGVESDLSIFCPRSQVVNWDCDTREAQVAHAVEDTCPDCPRKFTPSSVFDWPQRCTTTSGSG